MSKLQKTISQIPCFSGLPPEEMTAVERISVHRTFKRGELIFSDGDPADGFYAVIEGTVKIYKLSPEGKEQILHIFGPGEPFGEVPVFSGTSFPANAQAIAAARLVFFPREAFIRLISETPKMALDMLAVLSMRLRQFAVQIENLSLKEVPERLAGYLIYLSSEQENEDRVTLPISKGQLASLLGTIPETLSRIFAKMNSNGLIRVEGKVIQLTNREKLAYLSGHNDPDARTPTAP